MSKLSKAKRDQLILVVLGVVVAIVGIYYGIITGQKKTLAAAEQKAGEAKTKVDKAEGVLKRKAATGEELEAMAQRLKAIEDTMPSGDLYSWVLITMNNFITPRKISNFSSSRETLSEVTMLPKFPYKSASFTIRMSAHYHDFGAFLADFENQYPYVRIQNIDMGPASSQAAGAETEQLDISFQLVTLVRPPS